MIRHVVVFRFGPSFSPELEERWRSGVESLESRFDGLRSLTIGKNVLDSARAYDYAIVADFDGLDDVAMYTVDDAHQELIAISSSHAEHIAAVDFELSGIDLAVAP